jgi:hypothetical protein
LRIDLDSAVLPASIASSRRSRANHCRILVRARGDLTNSSQSRDGPAPSALDVKISTVSPLSSALSSATSLPLTRAPMQRCDLGVHRVGEVDRGGPAGQAEDVPLRGEHVHLAGAEVVAQRVEELLRLLRLALPVEQLAQPAHLLGHPARVGDRDVLALLVLPVRGDAVLGGAVLGVCADLQFHRLAGRADDRGVQ